MSRAGKKNGPTLHRGAAQGVNADGRADGRRDSQGAGQGAQLFADSRSRVAAAVRAAELREAQLFAVTPERAAHLRLIAATKYAHRERMVEALQTGELTAADAATYLDTQQPHARLCGLREEGLPVVSRWVLTLTKNGHTRRVKAYRMEPKAPHE